MDINWKIIAAIAAGTIFLMFLLWLSPKWFITVLLIGLGFSMVWKTNNWLEMFGRNEWAEAHLTSGCGSGMGGSWMFYKMLGIVIIIGAFLYVTGSLQAILYNILGAFFGSKSDY